MYTMYQPQTGKKGKLLEETPSPKSEDSKENENKNKGKTWTEIDDNGIEYETNDAETPDSEW